MNGKRTIPAIIMVACMLTPGCHLFPPMGKRAQPSESDPIYVVEDPREQPRIAFVDYARVLEHSPDLLNLKTELALVEDELSRFRKKQALLAGVVAKPGEENFLEDSVELSRAAAAKHRTASGSAKTISHEILREVALGDPRQYESDLLKRVATLRRHHTAKGIAVFRQIRKIVRELAPTHGIDVVFKWDRVKLDSGSAELDAYEIGVSRILYRANVLDITDEVIRRLGRK